MMTTTSVDAGQQLEHTAEAAEKNSGILAGRLPRWQASLIMLKFALINAERVEKSCILAGASLEARDKYTSYKISEITGTSYRSAPKVQKPTGKT